jgi:hypothetical protein
MVIFYRAIVNEISIIILQLETLKMNIFIKVKLIFKKTEISGNNL